MLKIINAETGAIVAVYDFKLDELNRREDVENCCASINQSLKKENAYIVINTTGHDIQFENPYKYKKK
jgi:hypothetical protein